MLKSCIQLSQYDFSICDFEAQWAAPGCQALIGEFETACMLRILLVAELGTDHIEKAVCMISASIFSKNVGGMKLKFGDEIEQ